MLEYCFDDIVECECVGEFDDEYVYDIEVDDDNHTFFANDMLVHNSLFVAFGEALHTIKGFKEDDAIEYVRKIYEYRLKDYFIKIHDKYAENFNTKNIQDFELETISHSGIWLAKKKYVSHLAWKDAGKDGIYFDKLAKLYPKGIEIRQKKYPKFIRKSLEELIKDLLTYGDKIDLQSFINKIKIIKNEFKLQNIDNISFIMKITDYDKYVINDKGEILLEKGCPWSTRGAAIYNNMLYSSKYNTKYERVKNGTSVKVYYVKTQNPELNLFSYIPGSFPAEFAPDIDYEVMFDKMLIEPINRFMNALELMEVPKNLLYLKGLF